MCPKIIQCLPRKQTIIGNQPGLFRHNIRLSASAGHCNGRCRTDHRIINLVLRQNRAQFFPVLMDIFAERCKAFIMDKGNRRLKLLCRRLSEPVQCYEMAVQRNLSGIFEYIFCQFEHFPKSEATRIRMKSQIRLQKMLTYIYEHYPERVTLEEIARAAHISRSEAGRCFRAYMDCSPVDALIQYRLRTAHRLLSEKTLTLQEISAACGFHSVSYFSRKFRETYGHAPSQDRTLGK